MEREIPIFFSVDDAYAPFLAVALSSAIKNSSTGRRYRAIVLYRELSEENIARLKALEKAHFKIDFVAMQGSFDAITDRMSNRLRCDYFTLTIYFRLFIPRMFSEYDKAIYIDSDVVVVSDLAELFDADIEENLIGACVDKSVGDVPELVMYMEEGVGVPKDKYINSGVLLMNLRALREKGFDEHFLNLLGKHHFDSIAPDQDYINAICHGKIYYLGEEWDTMPNDKRPKNKNAKLIHYNLFSKPWCYDNVQYEEIFWEYADDCGYIKEITEYKAEYTDEKKQADAQCLELLVRRGVEICEKDVTFKKVFESGERIRL